jgi:signal transduction histidine kinase
MKEIPVETIIGTTLPMVQADQPRLIQVIANLIRASLKNAPRGGRVTLNVAQNNGHVELRISHGGHGYPAEKLQGIVSLFNGGDTPPGVQDGLKITLALAKEIVQAHGGEIGIESRGENQGSTFWIKLPTLRSA